MKTFGKTISDKRKSLGISQKDLAGRIKKDDGDEISAQYLNDIEHDRRNPPSEHMIRQFAGQLDLDADFLCLLAGTFPEDLRERGRGNPEEAREFFAAFRRKVK
jgi:transcriptional regulator with XRE-family HTH domain